MSFDAAFTRLLVREGEYSANPADPGGKTRYGVTEKVARAKGYVGDMRDLPIDFAKQVYYDDYWRACRCGELPLAIRFDVFDAAVNSGPARAIRWLQRAVHVREDGVIGPQTLAATQATTGLAQKYNGQRLLFMTNLPTWGTFGKGWARRIAANLLETQA